MTVKELKEQAKKLNIKAYYKLNKADLIKAIEAAEAAPAPRAEEQEEKTIFNPEVTALYDGQSESCRRLTKEIQPGEKILEHGAGALRNLKYIADTKKIKVYGVDIQEQLNKEKDLYNEFRAQGHTLEPVEKNNLGGFDKILSSFVLNVIELDQEKSDIVKDIYNKLKPGGHAYFEVRTKRDVESSSTKKPHGAGWKIKNKGKYTYQEALTPEKLAALVVGNGFDIVYHDTKYGKHIIKAVKAA